MRDSMKNHSHSSSHLTKTGGGKGKRTFCKKTLVLAVSSALAVIASPSLLNAQSVSGPASNSVIQWQATTADGDRTIHIQYPDGTRYYQYNYTGTPSFTGRQDSLTGNVSGDFKGSDFTNADPNATAVSYTHLDVYKRQCFWRSGTACWGVAGLPARQDKCLLLRWNGWI